MKVSVIAWDGNIREYLHTIDFFAQQDFPQKEYEFIWVDFYNSNDNVRTEINKYKNFRLLTLNNPDNLQLHLGKCINEGVKQSKGETIVIPDGDICVENDLLSYIWKEHKKNKDQVIYFRRYDEKEKFSCNKSRTEIEYLKEHCILQNPTNYAGCVSLSKKNFELIDGYETHDVFAGPGMNGKETYIRLRNAGLNIRWSKEKNIYHPWHPNTSLSSIKDIERKALKFAQVDFPWIIPYSGIKQSWISHCRELNLEFRANLIKCNEYLLNTPKIDMDYYRGLVNNKT